MTTKKASDRLDFLASTDSWMDRRLNFWLNSHLHVLSGCIDLCLISLGERRAGGKRKQQKATAVV